MADTNTPLITRRQSRRTRGETPEEVSARAQSPTSAVSALTDSTSQAQRIRREDRDRLTLFQLSNVASPVQPPNNRQELNPIDEENLYDRNCYAENAGASDSEAEEDDDDDDEEDDCAEKKMLDDMFAAEDNKAVDPEAEQAPVGVMKSETDNEQWEYGAPPGWQPPAPPETWKPNKPRNGQPTGHFSTLDNPGGWSQYSFQPRFEAKAGGKYLYHCLPTGATPVPPNVDGKRFASGWEFNYRGWARAEADRIFRDGANRENMFPEHRKGSLCQNTLRRLGMNAERVQMINENEKDFERKVPDALFFYQLILPIHQIDKSKEIAPGVPADPRQPFYMEKSRWSNMYAVGELDLGSGYGHTFQNTTADEWVRWDGVLVMDGVRGGSKGAILRRFDKRSTNTSYDEHIDKAITKTRWLEMKRVAKLNNNVAAKKRGEEGYDPAYKYDYVFDTLVHNTNALTLYAELDQCGDETSYAHEGHGEPESGLVSLVTGKPGISKGMQTVIVSDVEYLRPRAYIHRHKKNIRYWTLDGPNEVRQMWEEKLRPLCSPNNSLMGRAIFSRKPHFTFDNYFSGNEIMEYAAAEGFGLTTTVRRDRLLKGVPGKFLAKGKTQTNKRSRHARYEYPIFCVKRHGESVMTLTSFQSTSSCNIASVNGLNNCTRYCRTKERGRKQHRRKWGIEMNEARELYLKTYGAIDRMDHLIKNCNMGYRSWKYWHSGMIHGKTMAIVVAYDIYRECCAGKLDASWKLERPVDFHTFRERLALQMLQYSPKNNHYPGDEKF